MQTIRDRVGAPECLDVPFELKALSTLRTDDGAELGVFEGLASTFGAPDLAGDVIETGAFRASLQRPRGVKMLWLHDPRAPIGVWDRIAETAAGLSVKGRLVLDVQQAREALALLRAGALDALSIGFSVPKGGWTFDREKAVRRLSRIDLWEILVVTFPANPEARIARVKERSAQGDLPTEREFERFLARDAGFSRSQARIIVASGYRALAHGPQPARRDADRGPARRRPGRRQQPSPRRSGRRVTPGRRTLMEIEQVKDAVDELGRTWAAFRTENDRRAGRDQDALKKMNARMDQLEGAIRRASRASADPATRPDYGAEAKAYFDYPRHGTRDEPNPGNAARFYKAVTVGGRLDEGTVKTLTLQGRSLMPYAPVHPRRARDGSPADWTITWVRRTRLGGAWKDAVDVPLGEESEAYEVDVLNGPAVVRTITATASAGGSIVVPGSRQATYSEADQITDFGSEQAAIQIRVYQISSLVGRGVAAEASLAE